MSDSQRLGRLDRAETVGGIPFREDLIREPGQIPGLGRSLISCRQLAVSAGGLARRPNRQLVLQRRWDRWPGEFRSAQRTQTARWRSRGVAQPLAYRHVQRARPVRRQRPERWLAAIVPGAGGSAIPCGLVLPAASANVASAAWLPEVRLAAAVY